VSSLRNNAIAIALISVGFLVQIRTTESQTVKMVYYFAFGGIWLMFFVACAVVLSIDYKSAVRLFGRKPILRSPLKACRFYRQYLSMDRDLGKMQSFLENVHTLFTEDELVDKLSGNRSTGEYAANFLGSRSWRVWETAMKHKPVFTRECVDQMSSIEGRPWLLGVRPDLAHTAKPDAEFYRQAVYFQPKSLKYVPEEFQTFELCSEAWERDHSVAEWVRNKEFQEVLLFA
jgi:hypothetical protein